MCSLSQKYPLCKCNVFTNHLSSGGTEVKNAPASAGDTRDTGSIPGSEGSPGVGIGHPLQYSGWRIPGTEKPGGLQFKRMQRVRHDWAQSNQRYYGRVGVILQFELWQQNWHEFLFPWSQFIRLILIIDLSNIRMRYLSLLSGELSSFHLKEVLYSFSLANLNFQYQYSSGLGSLLNKIKVSWTQALR